MHEHAHGRESLVGDLRLSSFTGQSSPQEDSTAMVRLPRQHPDPEGTQGLLSPSPVIDIHPPQVSYFLVVAGVNDQVMVLLLIGTPLMNLFSFLDCGEIHWGVPIGGGEM